MKYNKIAYDKGTLISQTELEMGGRGYRMFSEKKKIYHEGLSFGCMLGESQAVT